MIKVILNNALPYMLVRLHAPLFLTCLHDMCSSAVKGL